MRYQGRITRWKDEQGYGFIVPSQGGDEVFVHIKAFRPRQARPAGDEIVTYELIRDANGRPRAEAVAFASGAGRRSSTGEAGPSRFPLLLAMLFFAFVGVSAAIGKLPPMLLGFYVVASLIAFAAYALDKSAAQDGRWRTPENTLHLLALLGGWPGALVAQNRLRHKSSKMSFLVVFWATVLLNCVALGLYLTPAGGRVLRTVLGVA
jgi:uncharacterized membrane protein YsdA (DUF1294 family)/cold shock CspA family protein